LPIKDFPQLFFQNIIPLFKKICKLQSSHYRNVSTAPQGTGCGSEGIRRAYFGSNCTTTLEPVTIFTCDLYESLFSKENGLWHSLLFVFRKLLHLVVLSYWPNLCINFVHLCFAACHSFASAMALSSYRYCDVYKLHISVSMYYKLLWLRGRIWVSTLVNHLNVKL